MDKYTNIKLLDCTLRDGGYYTQWDFDSSLVSNYYRSMENLPIDYVEIGYRSVELDGYYGEYFYCPSYVIDHAFLSMPSKKLAIILDVKNVTLEDLDRLLFPCLNKITLIRLAVAPKDIPKAVAIASVIKSKGFEVAFNVMYMSKWLEDLDFLHNLKQVESVATFFYMVDSYGGVTPNEVKEIIEIVKKQISIPLGFHGHNNLEFGLINTLTAIESGCQIVDATITGMGRGAGNLKSELLLTYLASISNMDVKFNYLSSVVENFETLKEKYNWGTNLPYMVSGANSLPQKQVMDWVGKRTYSIDSIITAIHNQKDNNEVILDEFNEKNKISYKTCIIVGGGGSIVKHQIGINNFIDKQDNACIIHASSKNASAFINLPNEQYFCLVGNEGYRMENTLKSSIGKSYLSSILPPLPRKMGTFIPTEMLSKSYQLKEFTFIDTFKDNSLSIAFQVAIDLDVQNIYLIGFDGYQKGVTKRQMELANENEIIISKMNDFGLKPVSLTKTNYQQVETISLYSKLID